ncbi:MAG: DNA polymerase [Acidimicrobiia bacterium]
MTLDPASVPLRFVSSPRTLDVLHDALAGAERVAIDTEVPIDGPGRGELRVMSVAIRDEDGSESAFVVDARDVPAREIAPALDGVRADAWNASFDARVLDKAVWGTTDTTTNLGWWDAQLGDALLHQGRSGFTWFHGLAWATSHYLGFEAQGKGTTQLSYTASDDLTDDQIHYAAADAVETLWVADAIRSELAAAGLEQIAEIEMRARPFLDQMERTGLPFDWDGWENELDRIETERRSVLGRLSDLTGGGQGTLFDQIIDPTWNPASDSQVRDALNRWDPQRVELWTQGRFGVPRRLTTTDSVDASALREIGGDLCEAVLEFRNHSKIITTYGQSIREHIRDDGRMHSQYLQVVGTNTGRLASRFPNAQNLTPLMLPFFRPRDPDRVFVHADLSQAELRYLAQVARDEPLRAAFARGDDVHVTTAATMFGFDPESLAEEDPDRFRRLRQIAKALNFGIAYGSGATALSRSLTAEGSPTTVDEASELLTRYRRTYPGTAAWAEDRINEIQELARTTSSIDWRATMRLARGYPRVAKIRRDFRRTQGRWPSVEEIAELHPDHIDHPLDALIDQITWLSGYSAPVALMDGGHPFTFSSRTLAGRRQQFNLHLDRLFLVALSEAVRSQDPALVSVRRRFEQDHGMVLIRPEGPVDDAHLERAFEDRSLRRAYLEAVAVGIGTRSTDGLLTRAASERVSAMVNAWRNAPIQGGVADIMLAAYADLHHRLRRFKDAWPVQTVHDSVVIECSRSDADAVAVDVRDSLEQASARFCPDVVPRADVDIRTTLADHDAVDVS